MFQYLTVFIYYFIINEKEQFLKKILRVFIIMEYVSHDQIFIN